MAEQVLYIGANHDVTYQGAQAAIAGTYLNTGTCTWRLLDSTGALVDPAATGTLTYTAASNGNYAGVIAATYTAGLTNGSTYYVEITFAQSGYDDTRRLPRVARYRKET